MPCGKRGKPGHEGQIERFYDVRGLMHMRMIRDSFVPPVDEDMECIYCGCTDNMACPGGCFWIVPYVCSSCEDRFYGTEVIDQQFIGLIPDDMKIDSVLTLADLSHKDYAIAFLSGHAILLQVTLRGS